MDEFTFTFVSFNFNCCLITHTLKFTKHFSNTFWDDCLNFFQLEDIQSVAWDRKLPPSIIRQIKALTSGRGCRRMEKPRWRTHFFFFWKSKTQTSCCITLHVEHRWAIRQQHIARWLHLPRVDTRQVISEAAGFTLGSRCPGEPGAESTADALTGRWKDVKRCALIKKVWPRTESTSFYTTTPSHNGKDRVDKIEMIFNWMNLINI